MAQLIAPGGFWITYVFAVQFHATAQPIVQPWPEPIAPRFMKSIPPSGTRQLSTSNPVDQRMCGWTRLPWPVKVDEQFSLKVTVGPHPNTVEHSIRWIMIMFEEEGRAFNPIVLGKATFNPVTTQPELVLTVRLQKGGVIHALEYCNLHGLWSGKKEIKLK